MIITPGARLLKFRESKGLSQAQLRAKLAAFDVLLPDGAISKIEADRRRMSVDELFYISHILEVSMACLSHGICNASDDWEILTDGLSDAQKQALIDVARHNVPLLVNFIN